MKIAILGDTHLGARNASGHYSQFFNKFFSDVFYPYLIEHDIKEVIQLGDLFDNRTSLSIKAYHACKSVWFDPLVRHGIHMTTILGNHDIFYKSSLKVNAPELLLANEYAENIIVINTPTLMEIGNTQFALVPWICDENKEEIFKFFNNPHMASVDIVCGHFEIDGFEMMRGVQGHGGLPRDLFDRFELTLSGHYHTKSFDEFYRIQYVGTPYEITFADIHDPRGFHIFDTETRKLEFIPNPFTMFDRIVYNDGWSGDVESIKGKSIKLVVEKKTDLFLFDRFVDSVKLAQPYELSIIENFQDLQNANSSEQSFHIENAQSVIHQYIDAVETSVDKDSLKTYMSGLYTEALAE
jgi:DNA repair exonuclease SbcCD nuclease subunit